jgi:hypothetical protein
MAKRSGFALLALVFGLALFSPSKANAGVVIGVTVAPVYPAAAYGYVVVHPRPYGYCAPPYPYAYSPSYIYPSYRYYRRDDWDRRWDRRDRERREWDRRDYDERRERRHRRDRDDD